MERFPEQSGPMLRVHPCSCRPSTGNLGLERHYGCHRCCFWTFRKLEKGCWDAAEDERSHVSMTFLDSSEQSRRSQK